MSRRIQFGKLGRVGTGFVVGVVAIAIGAAGNASAAGPHALAPTARGAAVNASSDVPVLARPASTGSLQGATAGPMQTQGPQGSPTRAFGQSALPRTVAQAAPLLPGTTPPSSLADNCSQDVSSSMQSWLSSLPAGSVVHAPAGACYLVNEGLKLVGLRDIDIVGGQWDDRTTPVSGASPRDMGAVFWFVGGSGISVEDLTISGVNPAGYDPAGAFASGIRSDGVVGLTVSNISVQHVYGDGVTLDPLRASNDLSGTIVRPSENVVLHDVSIDGAGRQGISLASASGAQISDTEFNDIGIDVIDVEADQWDEGAQNVTIDGCTVKGNVGGLFFANGGAGSGSPWTSNVEVEDCTMEAALGGDAIMVTNASSRASQRGPFTFDFDTLDCGSSVYVACVEVSDGNLTVAASTLEMPPGTIHEPVYRATNASTVKFFDDKVSGYGAAGSAEGGSSANVFGGEWTPAPGNGSAQSGDSGAPLGYGSSLGLGSTLSPLGPGSTTGAASAPGVAAVRGAVPTTPSGGATTTTAPSGSTTTTTAPPKSTTRRTAAPCLLCGLLSGG